MDIAIIGAGNVGGGLAAAAVGVGHSVVRATNPLDDIRSDLTVAGA